MDNFKITTEEKQYNYILLQRSVIIFLVTIFVTHFSYFINPIENFSPVYTLMPITTLASCFWVIQEKRFFTLFTFTAIAFPIFAIAATYVYGKVVQAPIALTIYIGLLSTLYLPKRIKYSAILFTFLILLATLYLYISDHAPLIKIGPTHSYIIFIGCIITFCYVLYSYQIEQVRTTELLMRKVQETSQKQFQGPSPDIIRLISHDLRAPVANYNNIGKKISYLLDNQDTDRLNQLAIELQSSGEDIQKLMDGMITIASDDMNETPINLAPINIEKEVRSVVSAYQKTAYAKSVQIKIDSVHDTVVTNEANRLRILFSNFVDNALKFSDSGTTIDILIRTNDAAVNCSITNTGRGFSKENIESFNKGGFISSTPGTNGELGYGIGLVSARQIARSINADITLSSTANNSTVRLRIPLVNAQSKS